MVTCENNSDFSEEMRSRRKSLTVSDQLKTTIKQNNLTLPSQIQNMLHIFLMLSSIHVFNEFPHINQKLDLIPSEHVLCHNPLSPGFFPSFLRSEIRSRTFGLIVPPVKLFYPNMLPALHQLFVLFFSPSGGCFRP